MPVVDLVYARDVSDEVGIVTCPNCLVRMRPVFIKPVTGEEGLCEVAYRCPRCSAETRRWTRP